jgi:hypothetical protein
VESERGRGSTFFFTLAKSNEEIARQDERRRQESY